MVQVRNGTTFFMFMIVKCLVLLTIIIDEVYASLQAYFNIEDDRYLNKYPGIKLDRRPYRSIHLWQPHLTQTIINTVTVMDKSNSNTNPAVKPPLETMRDLKQEK